MAFTREFIRKAAKESGIEVPKEFENALIDEHLSARDTYADAQVKDALEKNKPANAPKVKDSEEYKALKKLFDDYKADVSAKEARSVKEKAYRELLRQAGVSEKRLDAVLRVSDVDGVELDENGAIKDADKLTASIKSEWADFIQTTTTQGAPTATPPANSGKTFNREDIYKKDEKGRYVLSTAERQKALAEHMAQSE